VSAGVFLGSCILRKRGRMGERWNDLRALPAAWGEVQNQDEAYFDRKSSAQMKALSRRKLPRQSGLSGADGVARPPLSSYHTTPRLNDSASPLCPLSAPLKCPLCNRAKNRHNAPEGTGMPDPIELPKKLRTRGWNRLSAHLAQITRRKSFWHLRYLCQFTCPKAKNLFVASPLYSRASGRCAESGLSLMA